MKKNIVIISLFAAAICFAEAPIKTSFKAGEMTQLMKYRLDTEARYTGVEQMENMLVKSQGAAIRRPGTEYMAPIPLEVNAPHYDFQHWVGKIVTSPYITISEPIKLWNEDYTVLDTVSPPYNPTSWPNWSIDNYIYIGGGAAPAGGKAKPTKIDSNFNAVSGWPSYDTWLTSPKVVWDAVPSWDGQYVYVVADRTATNMRLVKLTADTGAFVWELFNPTPQTVLFYTIGISEDEDIFVPRYHFRPTYGSYSPAVFTKDGVLKKDYFVANPTGGSDCCSNRRQILRVNNKWYICGSGLAFANPNYGQAILQCYDDTHRVWDCDPWGDKTGTARGMVYDGGYFYVAIDTKVYDGGSKNLLKVDEDTGLVVGSAYIGAATGIAVIKTPQREIIFCTARNFYEINKTTLAVTATYPGCAYNCITYAQCVPDWYDYYMELLFGENYTGSETTVYSNGKVRLVPFKDSMNNACVCEFGNRYIGFYR